MDAGRVRVGALLCQSVAIAALGGVLPGCRRASVSPERRPAGEAWLSREQLAASQISTAEVRLQMVGGEITAGGRITFDDSRVAHVFSPVAGRVVSIDAQLGAQVSRGSPLARIASADVGNAFADLGKAKADEVAARREWQRQKELLAAHAGAERDLEAAQAAYEKARAEVARAHARVQLFRSGSYDGVTQTFVLRSPLSGEVAARAISPGMELQGQASGGNAVELFTVGSLDEVWLLADVYEADLAKVRVGAPVVASVISYPAEKFQGAIDWIAPVLDPVSRTAKVRCMLRNPDRKLLPEMYGTASIQVPALPALAVPRSAVVQSGDQSAVFVQTGSTEDGLLKFARRVVRVDENVAGDLLPVLAGLNAGEVVVIAGAVQLSGII
jgi:membrane fusion protein, heavy metal efflux system